MLVARSLIGLPAEMRDEGKCNWEITSNKNANVMALHNPTSRCDKEEQKLIYNR